MTRFVRFAMVFAVALPLGASVAQAQTAPVQDPGEGGRYSAEITTAATLGHTSSGALGGELDYQLAQKWTVLFEFGRMRNVASSALQARANLIANELQSTATPTQRATYYDFGVRYQLPPHRVWRMWHPYLAAGIGAATVTTKTNFQTGANDILVSTGVDLDGTVTKPLFVIGGGATVPFASRYFVDGTYRYGRIFSRTGVIENDNGINTQRVQVGVGIRF
jgi:opacity protein-like surface antigen